VEGISKYGAVESMVVSKIYVPYVLSNRESSLSVNPEKSTLVLKFKWDQSCFW